MSTLTTPPWVFDHLARGDMVVIRSGTCIVRGTWAASRIPNLWRGEYQTCVRPWDVHVTLGYFENTLTADLEEYWTDAMQLALDVFFKERGDVTVQCRGHRVSCQGRITSCDITTVGNMTELCRSLSGVLETAPPWAEGGNRASV